MATSDLPKSETPRARETLNEWVESVRSLVDEVEGWVTEAGWATRRLDKSIEDGEAGTYNVPALLMQRELTKVLLEPVGRLRHGSPDGVVDLYRLPVYDDIAQVLRTEGRWSLHQADVDHSGKAAASEAKPPAFLKNSFIQVLDEIGRNGR